MGKRVMRRQIQNQQKRIHVILALAGGALILAGGLIFMLLGGPSGLASQAAAANSTIPVNVNYPAPVLSLQNINGRNEALTDYRDKIVLVNNWATWCPPCKAEMPTLVAYYQAHAAEGFVIVSVEAGEPKAEVQKFVDLYQMPFPVWLDPDNMTARAFKNTGLPSSFVIDRTGAVRVVWVGEINRAMLEKFVTPLLAAK
jgi:thiol-disulfide isomerase/thioredoxin